MTQPLRSIATGLPLVQLGVSRVACVSRLCWRAHTPPLDHCGLLFVDWAAAMRRQALVTDRRHVIVADPPYQAAHTVLLDDLKRRGAVLHLCYDSGRRAATIDQLRFRLHPRAAMVALYRAWRDGIRGGESFAAAAEAMWIEHGDLPAIEELIRAADVLRDLGLDADTTGEATMRADGSPAYQAVVRAYSEAVELCRTL